MTRSDAMAGSVGPWPVLDRTGQGGGDPAEDTHLHTASIRRSAPSGTGRDRLRPFRASSRRLVVAALAAAIALSLVLPALRVATVAADGGSAMPDVTFYGRGYGHGVGMSQYGARG